MAWEAWSDRFVGPEGRVVDTGQGDISHSEGQGYGLLLAQASGDRARFDAIEDWSARNLAIRQDSLMAWRWEPDGRGVVDWRTATDGDLFRAWALLRAGRDSGWPGYLGTAEAIAHAVVDLCLTPDPRAPEEMLIKPSAEAYADEERVLLNPSYIMPRALRELGQAFGLTQLVRAADHGDAVLSELASMPFLPDWILVTSAGFEVSNEHGLRWGYDALRIPLYLIWSGYPAHAAVASALRSLRSTPVEGHVATQTDATGRVISRSDQLGYRAIERLAECELIVPDPDAMNSQPYYPAVLHMLASVAFRESLCRSD